MSIGQVVILNGPSRSGKSSIVDALQRTSDEPWMNIGMDLHIQATPSAWRPGVGMRPQRVEDHVQQPDRVPLADLEELLPTLYAAMYESIAAHARLGLNVVTDVYHHDHYSRPLDILSDCARRIADLPVLFVGVMCPIDVTWQRREVTWGQRRDEVDVGVRNAVELAHEAAWAHTYDLELDTSVLSPEECVRAIVKLLPTEAGRSVLSGHVTLRDRGQPRMTGCVSDVSVKLGQFQEPRVRNLFD